MAAITIQDLNNAKADVDLIAAIATSSAGTATDRLGNTRLTAKGAVDTIKSINVRGAWVTEIAYDVKDVVLNGGEWYIAVVAHVAGATFADDLATKWRVHQGVLQHELESQLEGYIGGQAGRPMREIAGVVRNEGAGWFFIDDEGHAPLGFSSVSVVGDSLRLTYSELASKVVSVFGGVDETMGSRGLTFGPSVGIDYANFLLFMPFACWVDKNVGLFSFGNIDPWLGSGTDTTISTVDHSRFTITHKTASADVPPVATVLSGSTGLECRVSYGGNSIIGTFYEEMHGYVRYEPGLGWLVETPNISVPTFSFSAGVLTVAHEDIGDIWDVQLTGVGGVLVVTAGTPNSVAITRATSFLVTFQDYAGAAVTSANSNMKFHYRRARKVRTKAPDGTKVALQRGPVLVNPASVVSSTGNLWVRGLLQD